MTATPTEAVNSKISNSNAIIGVSVALGWPVLVTILDQLGRLPSGALARAGIRWSILAGVLVWATQIEGLSFSSLGFKRPTFGTLGWALLAMVTTFVSMGVYYRGISPMLGVRPIAAPAAVNVIRSAPMYAIVFTCLSAGIIEEMVFRFYSISRLAAITGNKWIASIIPTIVFVGLHIPSVGLDQVIPTALGGVVLVMLYWVRREYFCNALAHFLIDFSALGLASLATHK